MKKLKEKFFEQPDAPPEALEIIRDEHRKKRKIAAQDKYRKLMKRVEIVLSKSLWMKFSKAAKLHKMKLATFIKAAVLAYLDKTYLLPDEGLLHDLLISMRRIGNNINQISRKVNQQDEVKLAMLNQMQVSLNDLEDRIEYALRSPKPLLQLTVCELRRSETFRVQVAHVLKEIAHQEHDRKKHSVEEKGI